MIEVASRQLLLGQPAAEDEHFLNGLDAQLKRAAGGGDWPIVVDTHVNPNSGQVAQAATGLARVVRIATAHAKTSDPTVARVIHAHGARFTQYEFKRPLAERLTDAKWRETLTQALAQAVAAARKVRGEAGHRALIVGVGVHADASIQTLPAVRHDVFAMSDVAELLGFPARNIRTLQDENATLAALRRELQRLANGTYRDGDRVLIYFGGHGAQVPDDGSDEADAQDAVLVLHDTRVADGEMRDVIRNDELANLVDAIPTDNVFVLIDADGPFDTIIAPMVLSAGEISVDSPQGGLLTLAISEAIEGACETGKLTAEELHVAVARDLIDHSTIPTLLGRPAMLGQNLFLPTSECRQRK